MGFWSALKAMFRKKKATTRIIVVGLDNSGKTTMLNYIKPHGSQVEDVVPTVGFTVEEFSKHNLHFTCYDMSGHSRYRDLWTRFYTETQAIIFVVDASDQLRLGVAKAELDEILVHQDVRARAIPVLIFANKMDLPNACSPVECSEQLKLHEIRDRPWNIFPSVATTGQGLEEGLTWLSSRLIS